MCWFMHAVDSMMDIPDNDCQYSDVGIQPSAGDAIDSNSECDKISSSTLNSTNEENCSVTDYSDDNKSLSSSDNSDDNSLNVLDTNTIKNLSIQCSSDEESPYTHQNSFTSDKGITPDFDHAFSIGLLSIMDKHSLSYACVTDILKLFSVSLPDFASSSLHMLLKKYVQPMDSLQIHHCCGVCMKLLESGTSCTMPECMAKGLPTSSFVEVKIDYQLKLLFSGKA